ncbi:MAG: response regulator, partial [Salinivirgaceae bacterium]
ILITIIRLRNTVVIEKKLSEIKLSFFTNISHELRTPLTLILGPVRELASEATNQRAKYYTRLIEENATRLLRLVNQLLDFRKIQSQKMQLEFQETELGSFINRVCANFNELAHKRQINFKITHSANPIWVLINEEKMDNVFYNLLSNAFKFTPDFGSIEVLITSSKTDSKAVIEIIDTGIGINKEQEQVLFTVYASYSDSNSKINPGTGIGLVLAKELVNLHKGTLAYRPNPDGGSIFSVKLDVIAPPSFKEISMKQNLQQQTNQVANPPDNSSNQEPNKPRLLIVEDNLELVQFLSTQLSHHYKVYKAINGREGLKMALKLQPDIIISDVIMPVMDGLQLLNKIKNNFETSHIPVVLLTAKSSVESKIEGLRYGADAYLTKPFHNEQLHAQLQNLLQQRTRLLNKYIEMPENGNPNDYGISITEQDEQFLNRVRKLIEENLSNVDFRLEDIYKEVGMGRSKFFDKLKGLTGLSPIDFVKEYRLNKAFNLLQSGIHNVSETAFLSGYTDAGYFSKCFKERFGLNPSEIIKN